MVLTSQQIKRISPRSLQAPLKYWYLIVLLDIYDVRRWYALQIFTFEFLPKSLLPLTWLRFLCVTIFGSAQFPRTTWRKCRQTKMTKIAPSPVSCCPTSASLSTTCQICLSSDTYWTARPPFPEHPRGVAQALVSVMTLLRNRLQ